MGTVEGPARAGAHRDGHVDGSSLYFRGPDGERLELISDPLLEMYGKPVG